MGHKLTLAVECSNYTASPAVAIMILSLSSRNGNRGTRGLPLKHRNLMKYSRHQLRSTVKHDAVFEGNRHDVAEVVKQFGMRADLFVRASPNLKPISIFHSLFTNGTSLDLPISDSITHCALEITKAPPQNFARWKRIASDSMFTNIVSAICFSESACTNCWRN